MKTKTKTKAKTRKTKTNNTERTFVAFLLDRTGSMIDVKDETINGFNSYLEGLLKEPKSKDIVFHMTQFDSEGIDVLHDAVPLNRVARLTKETFVPRSFTPLYDAIGKTIQRVEKKVNGSDKVLFVTLTDGRENNSTEWRLHTIKNLILEKEKNDKWTFTYIGVGPEAWEANANLSSGTQGYSNNLRATRGKNTQKAYAFAASATMTRVATAGGQCIGNLYGGQHLDKDEEENA